MIGHQSTFTVWMHINHHYLLADPRQWELLIDSCIATLIVTEAVDDT